MANETPRLRRVAEQIKRELSHLIATEVKDPRVRLASITDVEVSRDLGHAQVFVSVLMLEDSADPVLEGLRNAAGFLRGRLGRLMRVRTVPELRFVEDRTEREAERISHLIDDAVAEDRRRHGDDSTE